MDKSNLVQLLRRGPEVAADRGPLCPDEVLLVDFTAGELSAGERAGVREHLADCGHCLRTVGFLSNTAAAEPAGEVSPLLVARANPGEESIQTTSGAAAWRWSVAAVLVASVSYVVWQGPGAETVESEPLGDVEPGTVEPGTVEPGTVEPGTGAPEARFQGITSGAPRILYPAVGAIVRPGAAGFRWTDVRGAVSYELRIVSPDGDVLFERTAFEPEVALPLAARLTPGGTYFVHVSALLSSGKRVESEHSRFIVEGD